MKFIKKNIVNGLLVVLLLIIMFVPDAKAFLIKGLMITGFYNPKVAHIIAAETNLNGIRFEDVNGKKIDLGDLQGKVIFINFWATWCPPCRAEMPSINKLYKQFKEDKNVVFLFVDADGKLSKSAEFMKNRRYEMPVYKLISDIPKQIFESALPTTVIFDKQGRLSFRHEGVANYNDEKFVEFLNKLTVGN